MQPLNNEAFHYKTAVVQDSAHLDILNGFGVAILKSAVLTSMLLLLLTVDGGPNLYTGTINLWRRGLEVERSSFTHWYSQLLEEWAIKPLCFIRNQPAYQKNGITIIMWLGWCELSFCLLRSVILCIRGAQAII